METTASLFAAITTTLAAMMTAANLGPRVTGWGFVVFTLGAVGWLVVAWVTGQTNLLWQNGILLLIDIVGIWRWLGREARAEEGAKRAAEKSEAAPRPTLFPASRLKGSAVLGPDQDTTVAHSVDAMVECDSGRIAFVVLREGGVGGIAERFHALPWDRFDICQGDFTVDLDADTIRALPAIEEADWPAALRPA
ncbi:PRC-barrel domain-containing protein [Sphingomonas sp. ID0503]|uniref:PRC-barrel domain-containing protein n=1 Tax=Sphingomonas sp. ID0503 TaxID=3399691 RepID=UPI003AFAEC81